MPAREMADMTFGFLMVVVAGGLTMISLGIIIIGTNVLKSFQSKQK